MALLKSVTQQQVVDFLNSLLLEVDGEAINALFNHRTSCNSRMADHPTVQAGRLDKSNHFMVGIIGVLNGLFGIHEKGYGFLAADYKDGEIIGFRLRDEEK